MCFGRERNAGKGDKMRRRWKKIGGDGRGQKPCRRGEKERQRDGDVKIESGPESGEVQPGQRWRDSAANKVQSAKERGFSVEFREAVNPNESAIQPNIYSANRIRRGRGGERWMGGGWFLFICTCTRAAQYEDIASIQTIFCISGMNSLPIC